MRKAIMRTAASGALAATMMVALLGLGLRNRGRQGVALAGAPAVCSGASLQGTYAAISSGFALTGSGGTPLATPTPFAAVGLLTFDGVGGGTAALTENAGGRLVPINGTIIYSVNAECTGSLTLQIGKTRTRTWSLVVEGAGQTVRVATDNIQFAIGLSAELLPAGGCSDASLQGAYGGLASGFLLNGPDGTPLPSPQPFVEALVWTLDGAGNATLDTQGPDGATATYSVNADCTGAWIETSSSGVTTGSAFVVLGGGTTILMEGADPGKVVSFSADLLP